LTVLHRAKHKRDRRPGFTLVELLIVLVIMAIVAAMALPMTSGIPATRVIAAARLVAADLEFAQQESIVHADDPCLLKLNQGTGTYWVARVSAPDTPIADPANPAATLSVTFGGGRANHLGGVSISSYDFDGDAELRFDAFGQPDQTTAATIVLASDGVTMTISVDPQTGEVTATAGP
jgi:prepilin-type N-terminal cleavage/methylation domain-containing protein